MRYTIFVMKRKHHSHIIFLLIGLLVLIFALIFGVQYFKSEYSFNDVIPESSEQSYDEGSLTDNPFVTSLPEQPSEILRSFASDYLRFSYPARFDLRIMNARSTQVLALSGDRDVSNCSIITDEMARAECFTPPTSPNIKVEILDNDVVNPFISSETSSDIMIGNSNWKRFAYNDEFGGSVWYQKQLSQDLVQISYRHADVLGGQSFESLNQQYTDTYQLSRNQQDELARMIIQTVQINQS